jgi:hypothetical protein
MARGAFLRKRSRDYPPIATVCSGALRLTVITCGGCGARGHFPLTRHGARFLCDGCVTGAAAQ